MLCLAVFLARCAAQTEENPVLRYLNDCKVTVVESSGKFGEDLFVHSDKYLFRKTENPLVFDVYHPGAKIDSGKLFSLHVFEDFLKFVSNEGETLAEAKFSLGFDGKLLLNGMGFDEKFRIKGLLDEHDDSVVILASTDSDLTYHINIEPLEKVTPGLIIGKLTPALSILFFYGFGRMYQRRFWKQFNSMNTVTLQRHINEAK